MSARQFRRKWVDPEDFRDARKQAALTRDDAAEALNVTTRTIQNWETGGARIPWMAMRMLRILRGYALPGHHWEGWTVRGDKLYAPNGHSFDAANLAYIENVFSMARLWRQMYSRAGRARAASTVVDFPERRRTHENEYNPLLERFKQQGGTP
jgi:DNA-binding XRE family transcriptional regulator